MGAKIKTPNKSLGLQTKPKKIPGPKFNPPKKSNAEFSSHKNFQKALNDITITNLQIVLNTPQNPYLNQLPQKILAKIILPKKNPEIEDLKPKKIVWSYLSLEIRSTPAGVVSHSNVPLNFGLQNSINILFIAI